MKNFYLWDMANTLIPEKWNVKKSGFPSYGAYVQSLGYDLKTIRPSEYEGAYERPYKEGLFGYRIAEGAQEVLSWTKHNFVFTTGNREQIDWRAEYLKPKCGFDLRDYLTEIYSTFDYGNTNTKTPAMLMDILRKKYHDGYETAVYADDKEANCQFFLDAVALLNKEGVPLTARAYHVRNDERKFSEKEKNFFSVANLLQLLENEKSLV